MKSSFLFGIISTLANNWSRSRGVPGFGSHSNNAEYIDIDSFEPRLYLLTRMVMDRVQERKQ
jgi:hypothetical protein